MNGEKVRYAKIISYTQNMDLINISFDEDEKELTELLIHWMMGKKVPESLNRIENKFIKILTFCSEKAVYKIQTNTGNINFTQSGIYETLSEEDVSLATEVEKKGTSRILMTLLKTNLNEYVNTKVNNVYLNDAYNRDFIGEYSHRINNFLDIDPIWSDDSDKTNTNQVGNSNGIHSGRNVIFYGAPGTGKSFEVNQNYGNYNHERITFYPDYDYSDFVGGLKPLRDDNGIDYRYIGGPLANSIISALNNPSEEHVLIVEEINRANAASVFGDTFQLLDRSSENASSKYPIWNIDLARYIDGRTKNVANFVKKGIVFPGNFSIVATMNSADQGVYPLDTAFKRRWTMSYMPINWNAEGVSKTEIPGFGGMNWPILGKKLNLLMEKQGIDEDALLGQYFLSTDEIESGNTYEIAAKIFGYLWNDALKYRRKEVFAVKTFSEIMNAFSNDAEQEFLNVFNEQSQEVLVGSEDEHS